MSQPILNPSDVICYKCNGIGKRGYNPGDKSFLFECLTCCGEGKLDWIENIVGKEEPGVYVTEIDLSTYIPVFEPSIIVKGDKR